jgi:hypothetical protein
MTQFSLEWDMLKAAYPMRPLAAALKTFMDNTPGTPCCVQMSHVLSAGGCIIAPSSNRRATSPITTSLGTRYYLLAVDEMKWYLERTFGAGEEMSRAGDKGRRSTSEMMAALDGRTGILVVSDLRYGLHTELWDVNHMHQRDISPAVFNAAKVFFWDVMITATA